MLRADNIPPSNLMQSSNFPQFNSTIIRIQLMTPYKQQQVLEWVLASMPDPFSHISHTREQRRWNQRNSCLESTGTRFRQLGNQWHLQGKEQRFHCQPCSLILLTRQEDAPYNWDWMENVQGKGTQSCMQLWKHPQILGQGWMANWQTEPSDKIYSLKPIRELR